MNTAVNITTDPVPRVIGAIAVPASVGFFFNTMFNVVDTYFAGVISTQALAALSLSFPVFFIIIALGSGVATGTTALMATALGAGEIDRARMFAVQGFVFGGLLSIILTAVGLVASQPVFSVLGASGNYMETALLYMETIFHGAFFFIMAYMLNAVLNALGDTRSFRNVLVATFFSTSSWTPGSSTGGSVSPPWASGASRLPRWSVRSSAACTSGTASTAPTSCAGTASGRLSRRHMPSGRSSLRAFRRA